MTQMLLEVIPSLCSQLEYLGLKTIHQIQVSLQILTLERVGRGSDNAHQSQVLL